MHRRTALKNLGLLTGGMLFFPACTFSEEKATEVLKNLRVNAAQEQLLKSVVDVLLPEGDIPGAVSLGVHHFVWLMIDDMLSEKRQVSFLKGLDGFETEIRKRFGKPFGDLDTEKRLRALSAIKGPKITTAIALIKSYSILGYMQSEYIMTKIMPYALVPGSFGNCENIEPGKRINIYG